MTSLTFVTLQPPSNRPFLAFLTDCQRTWRTAAHSWALLSLVPGSHCESAPAFWPPPASISLSSKELLPFSQQPCLLTSPLRSLAYCFSLCINRTPWQLPGSPLVPPSSQTVFSFSDIAWQPKTTLCWPYLWFLFSPTQV